MPVADRFHMWACFDDEEQSGSYAEQVARCLGCGGWLNVDVLLEPHEKAHSGIVDF